MKSQDYIIADLRIKAEGEELTEALESIPGFFKFKAEPGEDCICRFVEGEPVDNLVDFKKDYSLIPGVEKILYTDGNEIAESCFATKKGGGFIFASFSNTDDGALLVITEEEGKISRFSGNYSPPMLKFACWMAYGIAALPYKRVALHASTILYEGKAILFLGESGTGKSTQTRLWRENIEGATMLNDDSPVLKASDSGTLAFGSPWSGKMHCYINEGYPVAACVRLSQAPYNKIHRLSVREAFAALHPSCPPPFAYDERLYDYVTDFLSSLLTDVPVYHMEALPNAEAAYMVRDTVFGK